MASDTSMSHWGESIDFIQQVRTESNHVWKHPLIDTDGFSSVLKAQEELVTLAYDVRAGRN